MAAKRKEPRSFEWSRRRAWAEVSGMQNASSTSATASDRQVRPPAHACGAEALVAAGFAADGNPARRRGGRSQCLSTDTRGSARGTREYRWNRFRVKGDRKK